jgi:trans-2-enoyl-CoA reductase
MSKRHVVQYFLELESQYFEMLDNVKDLEELLKENRLSQEDFNAAINDIQVSKNNYERIAYIMMLLNKPNRKDKREEAIAQSWYKALKFSSKEAIVDENRDALSHLKELIKKGEIKDE